MELPKYLYNLNPLDDVEYLLNAETYQEAMRNYLLRGTEEMLTLDEAYMWQGRYTFSKEWVLGHYFRPEVSETVLPDDAYLEAAEENLDVVCGWIEEHPDVQFTIWFPPYSMLYWDKATRQGIRDAVLAAVEYAAGRLLEPLPRGGGLQFATVCSEDKLDRNWQRLVLTHLAEKAHLGVLTGSPITDMRLTLTAGRAHLKHTEGGDFRQATYRAVRQGLMGAQSVLLEPWYDFRLELPGECLGRAMNDIQQMGGRFDPPEALGETALLTGSAPVSGLGEYWQTVASYTRGRGRLSCAPGGYQECHNGEEVIERLAYDPEADLDNSPDSVFCAHGAGFPVKWDQVPEDAHLETGLDLEEDEPESAPQASPTPRPVVPYPSSQAEEKSLQAIFERTYGQVRRKGPDPGEAFRSASRPLPSTEKRTVPSRAPGAEFLLVDGYNIIFAWDELKKMAGTSLEGARHLLIDLLSNYQGYKKCVVILVFDAYKVKGNPGSVEHYRNIHVVYTKEAETADAYIERATYEIARANPDRRVRVATSDNLEQLIILGHGAVRVSAREFLEEVEAAEGRISQIIQQNNLRGKDFRQLKHQIKNQKK